jgi:hypothetical protein
MQIVAAALQMVGKDEAHQTQVMIAMEMTDEDVVDPAMADIVPHHLNLGSLTAIDQK